MITGNHNNDIRFFKMMECLFVPHNYDIDVIAEDIAVDGLPKAAALYKELVLAFDTEAAKAQTKH